MGTQSDEQPRFYFLLVIPAFAGMTSWSKTGLGHRNDIASET
jgi:hypothetical protein